MQCPYYLKLAFGEIMNYLNLEARISFIILNNFILQPILNYGRDSCKAFPKTMFKYIFSSVPTYLYKEPLHTSRTHLHVKYFKNK